MSFRTVKRVFIAALCLMMLLCITLGVWMFQLSGEIDQRLKDGWFTPPVEIFSTPEPFFVGQKITPQKLAQNLKQNEYRHRSPQQRLFVGDYSQWPLEQCQGHLSEALPENSVNCTILKTKSMKYGPLRESQTQMAIFDEQHNIVSLFQGEPLKPVSQWFLSPKLFAQYYGNQPILRRLTPLPEIPLACLQSVTAIEDNQFLDHKGISVIGILRAITRNVFKGRISQGGSTITQQLVKNYFLTSERTFKRKFIEIFMAIVLETKIGKDEILESYLNVIYMGQNGPFQVRGFGAASQHYLGKPLQKLDISECALLAAIVNSPGRFNPFRHPERALKRRNRVLAKLKEYGMSDDATLSKAKKMPLPQKPPKTLSEPAPYFVQAALNKVNQLGISKEKGLRIFTTLREEAQEAAQQAIKTGLAALEKKSKTVRDLVEKKNEHLESLLISVHIPSGDILALVGGRSYRKTQYNRALLSHRQVGSLMKPFVYLAALEASDEDGKSYHPLSSLSDDPFTYKYDGQTWSPNNYKKEFQGPVPLYYALKNSKNVPTARLATTIGLNSVIDVARRMGIESKINPLPSLSLGSFELYPWELTRAYSTLARMGELQDNHFILAVEDLKSNTLYKASNEKETVIAPTTAAVLVGMMKQTVATGTARSIPSWRQFFHPTAGKTGTTSDTKDAWFVGFTPDILTLVWVGFDKNYNHSLTGASGAIPIWAHYMKNYAAKFPIKDFNWPEGTEIYVMPGDQLNEIINDVGEHEAVDTPLIFRSENVPQ